MKEEVKVTQSCPTLCDPVDCSLPGSSIRGILQARILMWVADPFSRGSSKLTPPPQKKINFVAVWRVDLFVVKVGGARMVIKRAVSHVIVQATTDDGID